MVLYNIYTWEIRINIYFRSKKIFFSSQRVKYGYVVIRVYGFFMWETCILGAKWAKIGSSGAKLRCVMVFGMSVLM